MILQLPSHTSFCFFLFYLTFTFFSLPLSSFSVAHTHFFSLTYFFLLPSAFLLPLLVHSFTHFSLWWDDTFPYREYFTLALNTRALLVSCQTFPFICDHPLVHWNCHVSHLFEPSEWTKFNFTVYEATFFFLFHSNHWQLKYRANFSFSFFSLAHLTFFLLLLHHVIFHYWGEFYLSSSLHGFTLSSSFLLILPLIARQFNLSSITISTDIFHSLVLYTWLMLRNKWKYLHQKCQVISQRTWNQLATSSSSLSINFFHPLLHSRYNVQL